MTLGELDGLGRLLAKRCKKPLTRLEEKTLSSLQLKAALRAMRAEAGDRILCSDVAPFQTPHLRHSPRSRA